MTEFFNRKSEKEKRRALRREMTPQEEMLWQRVRRKQICDRRFRTQYSVGPYLIDFYCPASQLAVELDGAVHLRGDAPEYDAERQSFIERFGIQFLRFTNDQIERDLDAVVARIRETVAARVHGQPGDDDDADD